MKCERCGKDDAVVKLTRVEKGGNPYQICLCQVCASEASPYQKKIFEKHQNIDIMLKELLKQQKAQMTKLEEGRHVQTPDPCPSCGLDYSVYKSTLMLGCPDCYEAFAAELEEDLAKYHRTTEHVTDGEEPPSRLAEWQEQLSEARSELKLCIEYEDFERAAFLRDEITRLEKKINSAAEEPEVQPKDKPTEEN